VTVPALQTEKHMLAQSMSLTINGVDYVSNKRILSGSIAWKNNLMLQAGFYPGSGYRTAMPSVAGWRSAPACRRSLSPCGS